MVKADIQSREEVLQNLKVSLDQLTLPALADPLFELHYSSGKGGGQPPFISNNRKALIAVMGCALEKGFQIHSIQTNGCRIDEEEFLEMMQLAESFKKQWCHPRLCESLI